MTDYKHVEDIVPDIIGMSEDAIVVTPDGKHFIIHPTGEYKEIRNRSFWESIGPVAYLAGALLVSPVLIAPLTNKYVKGRNYLKEDENEEVIKLADELAKEYNVSIVIVRTDQDYYSDEIIRRGAEDKVYFISQESPQETAKTTSYLLRYMKLKYKFPMDAANIKRMEQATTKSLELSERIEEIKNEFKQSNSDIEPSLSRIAILLNEKNIEPPSGKSAKWFAQTVKRVLEKTQSTELTK